MKKNLLIIGGTYFTGRVLAVLAARAGHSLTFLNRGKYSMKFLGDIKERMSRKLCCFVSQILPHGIRLLI